MITAVFVVSNRICHVDKITEISARPSERKFNIPGVDNYTDFAIIITQSINQSINKLRKQ